MKVDFSSFDMAETDHFVRVWEDLGYTLAGGESDEVFCDPSTITDYFEFDYKGEDFMKELARAWCIAHNCQILDLLKTALAYDREEIIELMRTAPQERQDEIARLKERRSRLLCDLHTHRKVERNICEALNKCPGDVVGLIADDLDYYLNLRSGFSTKK